ncbi:hypothetical protein KM043_008989 [Ampulex compressa]|nr:hypothetical protein KM043_008989 [Ampulex compressa]
MVRGPNGPPLPPTCRFFGTKAPSERDVAAGEEGRGNGRATGELKGRPSHGRWEERRGRRARAENKRQRDVGKGERVRERQIQKYAQKESARNKVEKQIELVPRKIRDNSFERRGRSKAQNPSESRIDQR